MNSTGSVPQGNGDLLAIDLQLLMLKVDINNFWMLFGIVLVFIMQVMAKTEHRVIHAAHCTALDINVLICPFFCLDRV